MDEWKNSKDGWLGGALRDSKEEIGGNMAGWWSGEVEEIAGEEKRGTCKEKEQKTKKTNKNEIK